MKTEQLIEMNAELQTELTKDNATYYGNLIVYVRAHSLFRDEHQSEELLFGILQDILEAQAAGVTAEAYFGKQPRAIADEMLQQLPINFWDTTKLIFTALGAFFLFAALPGLVNPTTSFDVGSFIISGIYIVIVAIIGVWGIGTNVYHNHRVVAVTGGIIFGLLMVGAFLLQIFIATPFKLYFQGNVGIAAILLIGIIIGFIFAKTKDKQMIWPLVPAVLTSLVLGIISRIPFFNTYFDFTTQQGKIILASTLAIALLLQYLILFWVLRKFSKK